MPADEANTETTKLMRAFAPMHRSALGLACGVVFGGLLFVCTLVQVLEGGYAHPNLNLLSEFFWGYDVSWPGAFIGLLWGFGTGFVLGWGFALVRNAVIWIWLTVVRSKAEMEQYSDFLDHL